MPMRSVLLFIFTMLLPCLHAQNRIPISNALESDYSNLCINEIAPINDTFEDEFGETDDWIELYNGDSLSVYLDDIYFTDDFTNPLKWQLIGPFFLQAGGYFTIWMDGDEEQGVLHASFKLKSGGEQIGMIQLINDEVIWLDSISFGAVPAGATFGRKNDGQGDFVLLGEATPRSSNNNAGLYLSAPLIEPHGGVFEISQAISISAPDSMSKVFYTIDGSDPTESSILYTGSFSTDSTVQINAKAFLPGFSGAASRESFIARPPGELPVLSLELAGKDLFDDQYGIYVKGNNGITGYCVNYEANWNRDWEKRGRISMFEPDGSPVFRYNVGVKIGGGCSRGLNMKGFNLFFRERYGDPYIDFPVFPGNEINRYYRIKIRNAGDDFQSMMFRDGLNQMLLRDKVDLDLMDYRPAALYLNGMFWGIYELREHFNEDYIFSHHGFKEEEIDMIKNPFSNWSEIKVGSDSAFQELNTFIETHDLSVPENYQFVEGQIDMNEYINYHIAEIYLANYDWPAINNAIWRPRNGGKWRWMLFDTDGSTNFETYFETEPSYNSMEHATIPMFDAWPNSEASTLFLRKMLKNEDFRNEFIQRFCTFMELIFDPDRVTRFTDSIAGLLDPYVDQHLALWGENIPELGWGRSMGGSREIWEENIQHYKSFFMDRPDFMYEHINNYFGLEGTYDLNLDYHQNSHGTVLIHSNQMQLPYQFNNTYFKNIPIKLSAVPDDGYSFQRWEEIDDSNPDITFTGNLNVTLTPVFTPSLTVPEDQIQVFNIFPNPTNGMIHIELLYGSNDEVNIAVINAYGQVVKIYSYYNDTGWMNKKIDLSDLQDGVYYISITSNIAGHTEKIILIR